MILGEAKCPFHKLVCLHETDTDETDNGKEQHAGASRDHETEKLLREARLVYVHRVSLPARHEQDEENEQEPEPEAQDHSVFQGLQHHRLNVRGYGCTVNEIARSSRSDLRGLSRAANICQETAPGSSCAIRQLFQFGDKKS